jgi:cell division protein ZapA
VSDYLKIKVSIAGRVYPLNILRKDEAGIRAAAVEIDRRIKEYSTNYAVEDKQDLLAMCALQFASQLEKNRSRAFMDDEARKKLENLHEEVMRSLT